MTEPTLAKEAEKMAREMAKEIHGTEGTWELFFSFAYDDLLGLHRLPPEEPCEPESEEEG